VAVFSFLGIHGHRAVNISSFANGALGELHSEETDGIRLEIAPPHSGGADATCPSVCAFGAVPNDQRPAR
jgi:hypothetical protein